jgi:hypothetical protein
MASMTASVGDQWRAARKLSTVSPPDFLLATYFREQFAACSTSACGETISLASASSVEDYRITLQRRLWLSSVAYTSPSWTLPKLF